MVAGKLRNDPGQEYVIAESDDLDRRHTFSQTAWRINTAERGPFGKGLDGYFRAYVISGVRPEMIALVELRAVFLTDEVLDEQPSSAPADQETASASA